MSYEEWIASLNLPPGVGVSASEAFQAGQECYEANLKQLWLESDTVLDFAEEVRLHIGAEA